MLELFTCEAVGCRLTRESCAKRHQKAKRIRRTQRNDDKLVGWETCARCPIGAEHAGEELQTPEQVWKWPDIPPGTVVAGDEVVASPSPYTLGSSSFLYVRKVETGELRPRRIENVRRQLRRASA